MQTARPLTVAISARALFQLETENEVFERWGVDTYRMRQRSLRNNILAPGPGFPLANALLNLNEQLPAGSDTVVEFVILSRNRPDTAARIFSALGNYGLKIRRAHLTGGAPIAPYLKAGGIDLYLSRNPRSVQAAFAAGVAGAILYDKPSIIGPGGPSEGHPNDESVRIAFDGDAVLFGDESERIYREQGIKKFTQHERRNANIAMTEGPMAKFARKLAAIRSAHPLLVDNIRLGLFTARGTATAERVLRTFRSWGLEIDEAVFLGGHSKRDAIRAFRPHMFFDDQKCHIKDAADVAPAGLVPSRLGPVPVPVRSTPPRMQRRANGTILRVINGGLGSGGTGR